MSLTTLSFRHSEWARRAGWVIGLLVVIQVGQLGRLAAMSLSAPGDAGARIPPEHLSWPGPTAISNGNWSVFQRTGAAGGGGAEASPLKRFRLAGTFFVREEGQPEVRKAVLDDTRDRTQQIVGENDDAGGARVIRILEQSVVLRMPDGQDEELQLGFSSAGLASSSAGQSAGDTSGGAFGKFGGRQTGERSWVFSRQSLLNYYQELRDEPERLLKVFDSLDPLYDDKKKITGYKLGIEGEPEFWSAVGLKDGDMVRRVNSRPMTSRRLAEEQITAFVNGRASAFVIEIERGGKPEKLVYQIR